MAYNFQPFKDRLKGADEWLKKELSALRTGQATPAILDLIQVESYGTKVPIKEIGNISVEDAKTLRISPWDPSSIKDIERAITTSNLGLSVQVDDTGLRVLFPLLTSERRDGLIKVAKEKLEESKISIRKERERALKELDKDGTLNEDMVKKLKSEIQKLVDEANKKLDEIKSRKEIEILN
jgi:ribosome recycling factor